MKKIKKFITIIFIGLMPLSTKILHADNPIQSSYTFEFYGQYDKALALMIPLAQNEPYNYLAHLRAGFLSYMTGNLDQSVAYYRKSIALHSKAIEPRMGLLLPLLAKGNYREAEIVAQAVLRIDSKNYMARQKLAFSLYMSGQYTAAVKYYKSIIDDYPSDGLMHLGLGWSYYKISGCKHAKKIFQQALIILPADKNAQAAANLCP